MFAAALICPHAAPAWLGATWGTHSSPLAGKQDHVPVELDEVWDVAAEA